MDIEEQKIMVAEWAGYEPRTRKYYGNLQVFTRIRINGVGQDINEWTPEKGGKDLSEVLDKLDDDEYQLWLKKLPKIESRLYTWFQDEKNAPTIWEAVCAVIKEGNTG
jgi:hypothetical protein